MANFCVVAPVHILDQLQQRGEMGKHHLLLAHDVAAKAGSYKEVFKREYIGSFIVMDNSVIELKQAVDLPMIIEACKAIRPNCVVLPDILENAVRTVASCQAAVNEWATISELKNIPFMYCPQGKTLEEFTWCAEQLAKDSRINYWGCPRNLVKNLGSRRRAIKVLHILNPRRPIHMMGFSDNVIDDMICAQSQQVFSIDSAVPLRCGDQFSLTKKMLPRGDWWENGVVTDQTIANLDLVRSWCSAP